jgi:hypothetical protein
MGLLRFTFLLECLVLTDPNQIEAARIIKLLALQHRFARLLPVILFAV